ncbi:MAG: histidine phosphatase family protein [Fimbriimonadaceae bacterium]|nr:histidine phosphatase family protein [Fimbriimonadaceae bacterium]
MRLYLVRHGQTAWNAEQRAQGHSNIPLDPIGLRQAEQLGRRFADVQIGLVLSSDLLRAQQTAMPVVDSTSASFEEMRELRERGFGDWEGEYFPGIADRWPVMEAEQGVDRLHIRPPNGESFADVWERLGAVVDRLWWEERDTVVVTHGGACALLLARLTHGNLETSRSFRFANSSVTVLERRPEGQFLILEYNDVSHLERGQALSGSVDGSAAR